MHRTRIEADLCADVRGSWAFSGARDSEQEVPVRRIIGLVSTADLRRCHSMLPLHPGPGCFLKGKAGGPLWG